MDNIKNAQILFNEIKNRNNQLSDSKMNFI